MRFRHVALGALVVGACVVAFVACSDDVIELDPCGEIPAGGCPRRGDTCSDPTCSTVYTCSDGTWKLAQTCPLREGGEDAASSDASDGSLDAASPRDASWLDVPGASGGPGCEDLEPPDCPLARVAACPANQCCDCEDLYVCRDGGWDVWGSCANGVVTSSP